MKIAIIGCGKQAEKYIVGFQIHSEIDVVVFDTDAERAKKFSEKFQCVAVTSIDQVFQQGDVAGVCICTPVESHSQLIRRAAHAKIGVMCEKPIEIDLNETRKTIQLVSDADIPAVLAMTYRYVPAFQELKNILDRSADNPAEFGVLGSISSSIFRIGGRGNHQVWKHMVSSGGGAVNEMMVHMVDLAIWLFGTNWKYDVLDWQQFQRERLIQGEIKTVDAEDWVLLRMTHETGFPVMIQADFNSPAFSQYLEIQGSNGSFFGSIQNTLSNSLHIFEARNGIENGFHSPGSIRKYLPGEVVNEFVQGLRGERITISPMADGLSTQLAIDAILKSREKMSGF